MLPSNVSSVPLSQNTAPILEFRCLFTPDLKKKQKKWQDGRLKFHTFNKRIMVYDDRTNYVGDTHYHTHSLEEGDEVELERGVLVEVGELVGKQDQDLGEVLDAVRGAGKSARQASLAPERGAGRGATPGRQGGRYATPAPAARQMSIMSSGPERPLSALLGTPQGHYGRALMPTTSPFEGRQNAMRMASETPEPASKRRKVDSATTAQPLWARTSLMQSATRTVDLQAKPVARELSYPESIAPKGRVKKTFEKPAKPGYAQKLTGAVLDLSSTQKTNAYNGREPSPADEPDEEATILGSRDRASMPAPILPPVRRKPAAILPPKKPTEIVYPDSIAPKRKERKTFEKSSKAGYAEKLIGASLDLSSSNMAIVHKRRQPSMSQLSPKGGYGADDMEISDLQERPREETPILPPQPARKTTAILPPTAPRQIAYPDSAPKTKPRKVFEKKSKAGYAEKLTGAALSLSGAPAASMKKSQPSKEEEELLARLAELRSHREAAELVDAEDEVQEVVAPKSKKARISKEKPRPAQASPMSDKENEESLFVEDDFMDIDAIAAPPAKVAKPKQPRAPRKKKQPETVPNDADDLFDSPMEYVGKHGVGKAPSPEPGPQSKEASMPTRIAPQEQAAGSGSLSSNAQQPLAAQASSKTSQGSTSETTGSLRIKAKPKRKMLMMQSLPAKQMAPTAAPPSGPKPDILPGASLAVQKQSPPEPSQATKTLTDFHDRQREKLENRRKKIEAKKRIPIEIHSSPEPEAQASERMDFPDSPINLDEDEWVNPNTPASKITGGDTVADVEVGAVVQPTPYQQPSATPLLPQTTNRSDPFVIDESEESAITYTDMDRALRPQRSPFSRTATAPGGLIAPPAQDKSITPPPQPSLPQSLPAFATQQKERVKRPLPTFPTASKSSASLEAAKSSLRRPSVPLFSASEDEAPQSSLFVRQDSPNESKDDPAKRRPSIDDVIGAKIIVSSDDEDPSQPLRAARRVRKAQPEPEPEPERESSRQSSPDWPSDYSDPEIVAAPPKRPKARPIVDSSDMMSCPESQAEEANFDSSPPLNRGRELSAADEERLAKGHSVLVKIKSGIRSKEIIRPKSVNQIRTGDDYRFVGFARPQQPIIRSRTCSFVSVEAEGGAESENGVEQDEIMRDLETRAEEERRKKARIEEAQRRTREFREKKERQGIEIEEKRRAEKERLADKLREEEQERKLQEKLMLEEQAKQRQAHQVLEQQERERLMMEERGHLEQNRLADKLREEEEERERQAKRRLEQQLKMEAEEKAQLKRLKLEAKQNAQKLEQQRIEEEEQKVAADKERKGREALEARKQQEKEQKRLQKEKDDDAANKKLDEQAKYDEMRQLIEKEMQEKMDAQLNAMQEELRLSNQRLADEQERERLEKEGQQKAELQRLEDLRVKEQVEARQKETNVKKVEEQRLADLREKEKRDAEQLQREEAAENRRQQMAVEAAAAKLTSSASSFPRSLPKALGGFRADEAQAENEKLSKQTEYRKRVNTSFGRSLSNNANTSIEHIDIFEGGSCGEGDLILAAPKVTAFKMPAPRTQSTIQQPPPRQSAAATPNRSFNGFPTHIHAAMYANNIVTGSHDFSPTFQSTPPCVGYKVPSTLHLSAPSMKPFCRPKTVPIVPKKTPKTMKEIRDEKNAGREGREDLKRIPGWESKGDVLEWETGAWTVEAGDLFEWRPKVGDFEEE